MCLKIRCDGKSEKFCIFFWKINRAQRERTDGGGVVVRLLSLETTGACRRMTSARADGTVDDTGQTSGRGSLPSKALWLLPCTSTSARRPRACRARLWLWYSGNWPAANASRQGRLPAYSCRWRVVRRHQAATARSTVACGSAALCTWGRAVGCIMAHAASTDW
jgi:hypothetical protein